MKYETRTLKIAIIPEGEPIFSEGVTTVEILDEAGGEFLKVNQQHTSADEDSRQSILIDPEDWPHIKAGIEKMIKECRNHN